MHHDRRDFVKVLGASALALGVPGFFRVSQADAAPLDLKNPKFREWSEVALKTAKSLGCTYCDIRFTRNQAQSLSVRNGQLGGGFQSFGGFGGGDGAVTETYGFGVRVIHSGVWGFSSSPLVTPEEIKRITSVATDVARASSIAKRMDVRLAPVPAYDTFWQNTIETDPFDVPLEDKVAALTAISLELKKNPAVLFGVAQAGFKREWKFLATSEGSFIEQLLYYTTCQASATARHQRQVKTRTFSPSSAAKGYEHFSKARLLEHAEQTAAEAVEHAMAPPVGSGLKDLILLPSHLQLTIHEIIAHPTELDRVVGYEANYAGTSFITLKDLGKLKYGSTLFNVVADRTYPGGMGTVGYDDDGVKTQKWQIVKDGILVGLQTNRETAHYIGETESRGCTFANHWRNYPFLRMPNIQLEPGPEGSPTVDQMIADVKDGVLVDGTGSFSIDQQRYNGQFGGNAFWEIKNGKRTRMVTDFTYNAITTDFWANLDAVGPASTWEHHGMDGDAKGQPVQSNWPSHGSSPCLIRRVMVGAAFA